MIYYEVRNVKLVKRMIVAMCVVAMLCPAAFADVTETDSAFPDVSPDAPYADAVSTLAEMGILAGDDLGNFNPDKTITRAECSAVICRLMGVEDEAPQSNSETIFDDVASSSWAAGYISTAADLGIIDGYGDRKFGPSDPVTYAQMAKMLLCAWGYQEEAEAQGGYPTGYLNIANELGIFEGLSVTGNGYSPAPRSAVAQMAMAMLMQPINDEGGDIE